MRCIRYILLLPAVLLAACNKYDIQPGQADGFIKFFSSSLTEMAYDVKETADGGYVAIGTTSDEFGLRDLYLVKTDQYGNEESWSPVTIGGDFDDVGTSIQVEDDGFVILGYSKDSETSNYDMYLVKTDLQGNVLWEKRSDNPNDERGQCLQITEAGGYLTVGTIFIDAYQNRNYRIVIFHEGMEEVQQKIIYVDGRSSVENAYIIETHDNYIICGTEIFSGEKEINIIRIDKSNLGTISAESITGDGNLSGNSIQELSDGNLLICGSLMNTVTGLSSIYMDKLTYDLKPVAGWDVPKLFSEIEDNAGLTGNAVRVNSNGGYALIGTRTETGNDDIILLHTDAGGNEISRRIFGDEGFQQGVSLEVTGDGGLILVGNSGSEDNSMMALVKTDASGKL